MTAFLANLAKSVRNVRHGRAAGATNAEFALVVFILVILCIPAIMLISQGVQDRYSDVNTEVRGTGSGWGPFPDTVDTASFDTDADSTEGVTFPVTWDDGSLVSGWPSGAHMYTSGAAVDTGRWAVPAEHAIDVTMFGYDVAGNGAGFMICRFDAATGGDEDCTAPADFSDTGAGALVSAPAGPTGYDWVAIRFTGESRYDDVIVTNVGP